MPNWKKVVVSGSNVSQLLNDGVYLRTTGDGVISSSAQIAGEISGAFTATSASLSGRIDNLSSSSTVFASTGSNTFNGDQTFSGSLLPDTTEVFSLGSPDKVWESLYVDGQSIYMRDVATNTFVTMSANSGVLTFNNTRLNVPLGITSSNLILTSIVNAGTDTDKFLVLDTNGNVDFRTGTEILSDIGGQGLSAGTVSSSAQIQAYDIFLEKLDDNVISSSQQIKDYNVFATTGSNTFIGDQTITGSLAINDSATNFLIEGNAFSQTYLTSNGAIVLNPGYGGVEMVGSYRTFKATDITADGFVSGEIRATNGVISSSAQLTTEFDTRYLNTSGDGVISSSAQVDHDSTTNFVANEHIDHTTVSISAGSGLSGGGTIASTRTLALDTSSAHFTDGVKTKLNTEGVISSSAQLTGTFDTRYLNTTGDNVLSSSAQIAGEISGAFTAVSGGFSTRITSLEAAGGATFSSSVASRLTSVEGYTLDNVTDNGSTTTNGITVGGLTVNGNVSITGTASIGYLESISGSAKIIGDAYIILNNDTPAQRFAGIVIQDSGSTNTTSSLQFDGLTNDWFYEYSDDGGVTTDHGVVLFGPEYNTKGSPVYPSANVIQKGTGDHHLTGSKITDDGSTVTVGAALNITTVNAAGVDTDKFLVLDSGNNVDYRTGAEVLSDINPGGLISSSAQLTTEFDTRYLNTTGDGVISSSAQVTISSTTGYTTFSSSIASDIAGLQGAGYVDVGLAASSSRIAIWEDGNTIGGQPGFTIADGFIRAGGGTIRRFGASGWASGTVTFIMGSPVSCRGAFITYVIYSNDAGVASFRAGNVTAAWNAAGSSVVFNETTTTTIGTIPAITTDVTLIGGDMYVTFTNPSATLFNAQVNVDTLGV